MWRVGRSVGKTRCRTIGVSATTGRVYPLPSFTSEKKVAVPATCTVCNYVYLAQEDKICRCGRPFVVVRENRVTIRHSTLPRGCRRTVLRTVTSALDHSATNRCGRVDDGTTSQDLLKTASRRENILQCCLVCGCERKPCGHSTQYTSFVVVRENRVQYLVVPADFTSCR